MVAMLDLFSKIVVAVFLPDMNAETTVPVLKKVWLLKFDITMQDYTDQGTIMESTIFSDICRLWRNDKTRTTAYHPQGNGAGERGNRSVIAKLNRLRNEGHINTGISTFPRPSLLITQAFSPPTATLPTSAPRAKTPAPPL